MLIHANTAAQCVDDTSDCKEDYSLCILQPGLAEMNQANLNRCGYLSFAWHSDFPPAEILWPSSLPFPM